MKIQEARVTLKQSEIPNVQFLSTSEVCEAFGYLREESKEHLVVIHLDVANHALCYETVHIGGMLEAVVDFKCILRTALLVGGVSIILLHNHISGTTTPSPEDVGMTKDLRKICDLMGIDLFDHIIVAREGWYSMRVNNQL